MNAMRNAVFAAIMFCAGCAYGLELPDSVGDWRCVNQQVVPLIAEAGHENFGRIVYRNYERETLRGRVQVILTEGTGTSSLYVPENVNDSAGVIPANSDYKYLVISGHKAILEERAYMPVALAVNAGDNTVLTIETISLSVSDIVSFAEEILSSWKNIASDSFPAR